MTISVIIYRIDTSYSGSYGGVTYGSGKYIHVLLDDSTNSLSVALKPSEDPNSSTTDTPTSGPNLFFPVDGAVTRVYPVNITDLYKYCDGTDMVSIGTTSGYPYGTVAVSSNHPTCQISPTCDLAFSNSVSVTNASGPTNADGSFTVSATSTNGTIKYSLNQFFDYATSGQTSGTFAAKLPGTYTVYAKDALNCFDSLDVIVGITTTYGTRWRVEYKDLNLVSTRINIKERAYAGAVTDVKSGDEPFTIIYKGDVNNQYKSLVPSNAELILKCQTRGAFQDIFTGDDRKYIVEFNKDFGSGYVVMWAGFAIPEFYSEPYFFTPFDVKVTATDGLAELQNTDFVDNNGNDYKGSVSAIKIIADILNKAPLGLSIRSAVNVFDSGMATTSADDPLAQAYVDTRIYYSDTDVPQKCDYVLESILEPFGARIVQSKGLWWAYRIEYATSSTLAYREFDYTGTYSSNGTFNTVVDLKAPTQTNRIAWRDSGQLLIFNRNFGTFTITHNAQRDSNLIDEGRFEAQDLETKADGSTFFKNWNFFPGQTGISFGLERVNNEGGLGAFYYTSSAATSNQNDSILYSAKLPFKADSSDRWKVKFQLLGTPYYAVKYLRVGWRLRIEDGANYYDMLPPFGQNLQYTVNTEAINEVYIESYDKFQTFEIGLFGLPSPLSSSATIQLSFYMHNHYGRDYTSYVTMRTKATEDLPDGSRLYFGDTGGGNTLYYSLERNIDAESSPDIIRPNDYDSLSNPRQWILKETYFLGYLTALTKTILIDNAQIAFYPFFQPAALISEPPETVVYEEVIDENVKSNFTKEVILGDVPVFNNSENLYKGYFRLSDGTPTNTWNRGGVSEARFLLTILLNDVKTQLSATPRKLQGKAMVDSTLGMFHYINCIKDASDDKRYINTNLNYYDKDRSYELYAVEVKAGASGEPPADTAAFTTGFSLGFDS